MEAYELLEQEQHARERFANQPNVLQTVESADREGSIPTEPRDRATAAASSSSHKRRSLAAPIESRFTRFARIEKQTADLAKPYDPFDTSRFDRFPSEIPDSDEDTTDDSDIEHPSPTKSPQIHCFNCKGRLPREAPCFEDMDEIETQLATQPFLDPRRCGVNSMLRNEDQCDVLCILHPTTPAAYRAVQLVAEYTPQHILQNGDLLSPSKDGNDSIIECSTRSETASPGGSVLDDLASRSKPHDVNFKRDGKTMDIALRLSSKLIDPCLGFTFGRGMSRSDIILGASNDVRISSMSSMQFRIYLNASGIIMLEDVSTNGTVVDGITLRGNEKAQPWAEKRRMISDRSMVAVVLNSKDANLEDAMRFIVTIPSRGLLDDQWADKKQQYIEYTRQTEKLRAVRAEGSQTDAATAILPPTKPFGGLVRQASMPKIEPSPALTARGKGNSSGEWTGGENYNLIGFLGQGAFANVYKIATKRNGDLLAGKVIEKRRFIKNGVVDRKIKNEMDIMKDLDHQHIVKFIGHEETQRQLVLIMEYVPLGDLSTQVGSDRAMPEFKCQIIAWQLCSALEYLHKRCITHRDIKPENILIQCQEPLNVKLSDFGLSKRITSEDAFLQTFCGTLLYCAPEIYPGYDQYEGGKVKRRRPTDPPLKTTPYQQSVDIWALAAVLYHLLCARPPYVGSSQNQGTLMLHTIMNNEVDFGKLRSSGVSHEGIDFVSGMLKHDPLARTTEVECLQHPWIARMAGSKSDVLDVKDTKLLGATEEDEVELDPSQLSQLSLNGNTRADEIGDSDMEYDTDIDEIADMRQSKRVKPNNEDIAYRSLPGVHVGSAPKHAPGRNRLFGEIGASALRSSAVLGYDARAALEMPHQGSGDGSASPTHSLMNEQQVTDDGLAQHKHPLSTSFFTAFAPSLLGTEALVGQLNMASSKAAETVPAPDRTVTMPKTTNPSPESAASSFKRSSQVFESTDESTPKRAKLNRHDATSKRSQRGASSASSANHRSDGSPMTNTRDQALSEPPSAQTTAAEPISSESSRGKQKERSRRSRKSGAESTSTAREHRHATNDANAKPAPASTAPESAGEAATATRNPGRGRLVPVPGSVWNTTITLEERYTYFGRDPDSTFWYERNMDVRVPKNAMDIVWGRSGLDALIAAGTDWTEVEDLWALVHTRTSVYIQINGVKLTRGKDCVNYGRLHTGDVITIFGPKEGEAAEGIAAEFLKFRCEFTDGPSSKPRETPFVVLHERQNFKPYGIKYTSRRPLPIAAQGSGGADGQGRDAGDAPESSHAGGQATSGAGTRTGEAERRGQ